MLILRNAHVALSNIGVEGHTKGPWRVFRLCVFDGRAVCGVGVGIGHRHR